MTADKPSNLIPKLRFPEFQCAGDWKLDQIGNVASITKGKHVSKADITKDGATPCIRYAELYTLYREVIHEVVSRTDVPHEDLMLSQAEDVIVPASGETRVDIARAACVLPERVALGSDLNVLRSELYGPFLSYLLNSPFRYTIARVAQGDTVAHLYPKQLSQVWLAYPLRPEQQKIADCLVSLDDLIASECLKLEVMRQHKRGLMQQLFPEPGETVPRLRFPEFHNDGNWGSTKLGQVCRISTGKKDANEGCSEGPYPFFTCAESHIFSKSYSFDTEAILVAGNANVGLAKYYNGKFEAYQRTYVLTDFVNIDVSYLFSILSNCLRPTLLAQVQTSAMSYIRLPMLQAYELTIPKSFTEQRKIAECLSSLDSRLTVQVQKINALNTHKQGLLQQLFPSPEVE